MCPSITFKLLNFTDEDGYDSTDRIYELIEGLKCYTEYIEERYVARCGLPRLPYDLHPSTLLEMSSELRRHLLDVWHRSDLWFYDEGFFTEFLMRTSLALHRDSTLAIRLIMDDTCFREGYGVVIKSYIARNSIQLKFACPTISSIMLQLSVPGDRIAHTQEIFDKPDYWGRYLPPGTWKVDVLEGDAVSLE